MSHSLGCAVEVVIVVQDKRQNGNKGATRQVIVQGTKGIGVRAIGKGRKKGKNVRIIVA